MHQANSKEAQRRSCSDSMLELNNGSGRRMRHGSLAFVSLDRFVRDELPGPLRSWARSRCGCSRRLSRLPLRDSRTPWRSRSVVDASVRDSSGAAGYQRADVHVFIHCGRQCRAALLQYSRCRQAALSSVQSNSRYQLGQFHQSRSPLLIRPVVS
jgi:hypothetical protein